MDYKKLHLDKLNSFGRLLGKNRKEQNTSNGSSLIDNSAKNKTGIDTSAENKKNAAKKETNKEVSSSDVNNIGNSEKKEREFMELTPVDKIYEKNSISLAELNTIFIAESYLKTLPDYLPNDVKRKAVLDIIASSGLSSDKLLEDGDGRIKALNNFLNGFSRTTEKIVRDHENEIQKLSESIKANEKSISERKELQEEQAAVINYELHRLQKIINFLKGESN
ncbi:MAG: hypothetical protein ACOX4M_06500 [Acetivibrionales bacterium]|jgi:hypothetical protein